jgi:hypothetical protein
MWNLIFCGVLVGLPAGIGSYIVVNRPANDNLSTGLMLLLYAAVLGAVFAYLIPDGRLLDANFRLKMPGVFVASCVIGAIAGLMKRRNAGQ